MPSSTTISPSTCITLSNGVKMPIIGIGTWLSKPGEVEGAIRTALDVGYRHIDTAKVYENEEEIGKVLKEYFSAGKLEREDVFITTKLFPSGIHEGGVKKSIKGSLERLGLDYVDLYLVHIPTALKADSSENDPTVTVEEIWKGIEEIYNEKLARAIGVSNFSIEQIERIMRVACVPIHNHQLELNIHLPQFEMERACNKHRISLTAYAPLGSPGRNAFKKRSDGKPIDWDEDDPEPLKHASVLELAKKHNKSPAQILLRHLIQRGIIVIPKSTNEKRIKENFDVFDFTLSEEEMNKLNTIGGPPIRHFKMEFAIDHPEFPYKGE